MFLQEVLLVFCSDTYDIYMNALLDSLSIHLIYQIYKEFYDFTMNYYRFCNYLIILSFMLTIIPILLSYDIRDEIIELIGDMDSQIVVDTSVYKTNLP